MTRAQSFKPPPLTPNGDITMKPYTVEVTWRVPEYTHLTVLADSPAQAIELALATVGKQSRRS